MVAECQKRQMLCSLINKLPGQGRKDMFVFVLPYPLDLMPYFILINVRHIMKTVTCLDQRLQISCRLEFPGIYDHTPLLRGQGLFIFPNFKFGSFIAVSLCSKGIQHRFCSADTHC